MDNNIQWLTENGGAAIKLRLIKEGLISQDSYDINELADEILQNEKIKNAITYFDKFIDYPEKLGDTPYRKYFRENRDPVHGCFEDCLEMYMPFLIRLGFMKGVKVLDGKIVYLQDAYKAFNRQDAQNNTAPMLGIIITTYLLWSGYYFDDIEKIMTDRLNVVHKVTTIDSFEYYEKDINKIRSPKRWMNNLILKDEFNPYYINAGYSLPIIYDIGLMLEIYKFIKDENVKDKIDDVMRFILNPQYQKIRGNYGWIWSFNEKTYHACGPGICLPLFESDELNGGEWSFLNILEMMSLSPVMCKSKWFNKCMNYLEQYKTENGTYLYPDQFFNHLTYHAPAGISALCEAIISKDVVSSIKKNRKKSFAYELYGTFLTTMIKNRIMQ